MAENSAPILSNHVKMLLLFFLLGVKAIKIKEERTGKGQRYVTMTELEEKSAFYLRRFKRIGDREEIKEKVKIMCDRFQELYRAHDFTIKFSQMLSCFVIYLGIPWISVPDFISFNSEIVSHLGLDAIHDIFDDLKALEFSVGSEGFWQTYIESLIYPKPSPDLKYVYQFVVGVVAVLFAAVVLATPFSFKYGKMFIKGPSVVSDAEWRGADTWDNVLVRRVKKKTRKKLYKPMLPTFDLKSEIIKSCEADLEAAKEKMRMNIYKDIRLAQKKKKEWEKMIRKNQENMLRRKRYMCDDDEELTNWMPDKRKDGTTRLKTVINLKNLKKFWNGEILIPKTKKP